VSRRWVRFSLRRGRPSGNESKLQQVSKTGGKAIKTGLDCRKLKGRVGPGWTICNRILNVKVGTRIGAGCSGL